MADVDRIKVQLIEEEVKDSYLNYAMSVIVSRPRAFRQIRRKTSIRQANIYGKPKRIGWISFETNLPVVRIDQRRNYDIRAQTGQVCERGGGDQDRIRPGGRVVRKFEFTDLSSYRVEENKHRPALRFTELRTPILLRVSVHHNL